MHVRYRTFQSTFSSWENLFQEAADFASSIAPDRLISISHSADADHGVICVWYWDDQAQEA